MAQHFVPCDVVAKCAHALASPSHLEQASSAVMMMMSRLGNLLEGMFDLGPEGFLGFRPMDAKRLSVSILSGLVNALSYASCSSMVVDLGIVLGHVDLMVR